MNKVKNMNDKPWDNVYSYVETVIKKILNEDEHERKRILAELRKAIGKHPGSYSGVWDIVLRDIPESMVNKTGEPTRELKAVFAALTLFALHEQGAENPFAVNREGVNVGEAMACLIHDEDEDFKKVTRRFNAIVSANSFEGFYHYLKGCVSLIKNENIPLDYPLLAKDLYFLQGENTAPNTKLRWGQGYYSRIRKNKKIS